MCFHMYIDVCAHACVYVHFCNIPPQVLKLASLASPPPPPDFTTAGYWDFVAVVERLHVLHYSVDFIFLSFGIMCFMVEL